MSNVVSFEKGKEYLRKKIHDSYSGQRQGGISTPKDHPIILLFDTSRGAEYGYRDGFTNEGIYEWTGEGQTGVMTISRGNRAILTHVESNKQIHLFKETRPGWVKYVGEMVSLGYFLFNGVDKNGNLRNLIVFNLAPIDTPLERLEELKNQTSVQTERVQKVKPERILLCPKCKKEYKWELQSTKKFCDNCGSFLSLKTRYE